VEVSSILGVALPVYSHLEFTVTGEEQGALIKMLYISNDTIVVTSSCVTEDRLPILEVSHEDDEDGGSLWQFHCGNGDYSMGKMQLVRFDTILAIDPSVLEISDIKMGTTAKRAAKDSPWVIDEKWDGSDMAH
jgi:hypothetical protein